MSDQTVAPNASEQAPSDQKQKPARKRTAKRDSYSVTDLARARLRKRGVRTDDRLTDECKVVRGILRSNFSALQKADANVRKAKDAANDRKPWPTNMGKTAFDIAVNGKRPNSK